MVFLQEMAGPAHDIQLLLHRLNYLIPPLQGIHQPVIGKSDIHQGLDTRVEGWLVLSREKHHPDIPEEAHSEVGTIR